ncbi:hypothetical protein TWF730_008813 [Orbilia blumenaviensis]|uniref:F-box domain-containing protein n=1 Tax=Orbilia blumenaviensis TaxID=1796055 RepID=A0AAV9V643_9PEZI
MIQYYPAEIWLSVYDLLPKRDLKSFSRCSKYHRKLALPLLLRQITLSKSSIAAFETGNLRNYRKAVRQINFKSQDLWDLNAFEAIDVLRIWTNGLRLFPHVEQLGLWYSTTYEFRFILPLAVLHRISKYEFYPRLRLLSIDNNQIHSHEFGTIKRFMYKQDIEAAIALSPENKEFLAPALNPGLYHENAIPYPPKVQSLYITDSDGGSFDLSREINPLPTLLFSRMAVLGGTLKYLFISTGALLHNGRLPAPVFPSVEELWIRFYGPVGVPIEVYDEIALRFPSLSHLRLDDFTCDGYDVIDVIDIYMCLSNLQNLKKALVPWPRWAYNMDLPGDELVEHITYAEGLGNLDYIDFRSLNSFSEEGLDGNRQPRVCRVSKKERRFWERYYMPGHYVAFDDEY